MKKAYNVVFITDGLDFNGHTINERSLGGSETAMIYVAKGFAKLGNYVRVFCRCDKPGIYDGVHYHDNSQVDTFLRFDECDVLIVSRHFDFLSNKYNSKLNVLWCHDVPSDIERLASVQWNIDRVWCLSEYHADLYREALPDIKDIITIQANGFDPELVIKESEKKHQIMFTSRPERGLMKALDYYEQLGDKDLTFLACSYKTLDVEYVRQVEGMVADRVCDLIEKGFDIQIGSFRKEQLYKHIAESKAVIYPTDFPEIFCINAIEAQANGTPFITSAGFALDETVGYPGVPKNKVYDQAFLSTIKAVVYDEKQRSEYVSIGLEHVKKYDWNNVVFNMFTDIELYFHARSLDREGIIKQLYYESDLVSAYKYACNYEMNEWKERLENDLRFVNGQADYKEIYEDEETHEQGLFKIDQAYKNPRITWVSEELNKHGCKSLLDYACHTGSNSLFAKMHNKDLEIYGYDISEKAIEVANSRLSEQFKEFTNVTFSHELPEGKKFDAVLLGEVLEHMLEPEKFVDEIEEKYLNPGGKILITLPRGAWEHLTRIKNRENKVQYHVHGFELYDVLHMFGKKPDFAYTTTHFSESYKGECIGHYLFSYTSDEHSINKRNYSHRWDIVRPYQDITLCMITRDSEKIIEKTIDQIYEHVDAIHIYLDHKPGENKVLENRLAAYSKNKETKEFLVSHLTESIVKDGLGFGEARNQSISKVKTKWILWVDSDEDFIVNDFIRRYLDMTHVHGFGIKQHHSQIDGFIDPDLPNRLFRTGTGKFFGYIHEQAMSIDDINEPIKPSLNLSPCDIVNYGEMTEAQRRKKSQGRNLVLLHKDIKVNVDQRKKDGKPIRKLSIILLMRDFVNRIKWGGEKMGTYQTRDAIEFCLPRIMGLFNEYFKDEQEDLYYLEARKHLNEALILTGKGQFIEINIGGNISKTVVLNESISNIHKELRNLI